MEVRGCFWHAHGCARSSVPKTRTEFWAGKLAANSRRDAVNIQRLDELGWKTLEVWQCETKDTDFLEARLRKFLGPLRRKAGSSDGVATPLEKDSNPEPASWRPRP